MQSNSSEPDCTFTSDDATGLLASPPDIPPDLPEEFRTLALSLFNADNSTEECAESRTSYRDIDPSILKGYPLPSPEERQRFDKSNDVAHLRSMRINDCSRALYYQTMYPDDPSHTNHYSILQAKIQDREQELNVSWIVDDTHDDGGFYRSADGEDYKDFYGEPGAGGSGATPCLIDPDFWEDYCGNIPWGLLERIRGARRADGARSNESA